MTRRRARAVGARTGLHRARRAARSPATASSRACASRTTARAASARTSAPIPGPKEDRLRLTRATRANLSPIFSLYADPAGAAWGALAPATDGEPCGDADRRRRHASPPLARRRPRRRSTPSRAALADAELLIADGHHRYETARVYADEVGGEGAHRYVLMCLVALEDPGLTVFPTHRLHPRHDAADARRRWRGQRCATSTSRDRPRRAARRPTATGPLALGYIDAHFQRAVPAHAAATRRSPTRRSPTARAPTGASTPPCSRRSSSRARSA